MQIVNIHEAKTHLSHLIERAVNGEPFIIAKAGHPLVKVVAIDQAEHATQQRIGFMAKQVMVPKDFESMGGDQIEQDFFGRAFT